MRTAGQRVQDSTLAVIVYKLKQVLHRQYYLLNAIDVLSVLCALLNFGFRTISNKFKLFNCIVLYCIEAWQ